MENNNRKGLIFLSGAIAGIAAAYYWNTPSGKKLRKNIKEKTSEISNELNDKSQVILEEIKNKSETVIEKVTEKYDAAKEKLKETSTASINNAEDKIEGIQEGIKKAKNRIANGTILS